MNMEKEIVNLNIEDILPNRFQPRIKFKEENINELAESIKEHGVIQPIVVRKISDKYEIIAGERRYKASILAGKTTIPAIITNLDDKNSAEIALIENVQRQNLTPIEEAISYKKILDMGYINQTDLAEKLGKTQSTIANKLRLLNLDEEVQEALLNDKISERHARSLLKLEKNKQVDMLNRIINERMTVRKTDEEIQKILNPVDNFQKNNEQETEQQEQSDSEIEVLNFDLEEDKQNDLLEKTMELPKKQIEKEINNMNNNQFNIPSTPIIEQSNQTEMPNVNNNFQNINAEQHPVEFFTDQTNSIPENISNMESIVPPNSISSENPNMIDANNSTPLEEKPISIADMNPNLNVSPIETIDQQPTDFSSIINTVEENSDSSSDSTTGGKFFNMLDRNNQESINDLENQQVNMNFQESPNSGPFQMEFSSNPVNNNSFDQINTENNQANINSFSSYSNTIPLQEEVQSAPSASVNNDPFENKLNPYSLNDDQQFTNINDLNSSSYIQQNPQSISNNSIENNFVNQMNNQFSNINSSQEQNMVQERFVSGNLRMVINTIRDCASTIEKYGFNIDVEELDFENMYQVIFKIDKK